MATWYERATDEVNETVADVMEHHHPGLHDAEVKVDVLLAHAGRDENGDPVGPAVKCGGYQCAATIRITSPKERALGRGDALMVLDGDRFEEWSAEELAAVVDHELSHLEFTEKRDDLDRPKLRMVRHDHQFGWFDAVAKRHGDAAFEVKQAKQLLADRNMVQLYLPGFELEEAAVAV